MYLDELGLVKKETRRMFEILWGAGGSRDAVVVLN